MPLHVSARTSKQLEASIACKGKVYVNFVGDRNGASQISNDPTKVASNYTALPSSDIIGVRCFNGKVKPWIIGSLSNGLVTDNRWTCTSQAPKSHAYYTNNDIGPLPLAFVSYANKKDSPWGKISGISEDAVWISTVEDDITFLFCVRRLSDVSLNWVEHSSKGMLPKMFKQC